MNRSSAPARILLFLACCLQAHLAAGADRIRIFAAGPEHGVQMRMARDIARHVAHAADIELEVRPSAGSPDTLLHLHETGILQFAFVQSDAAHAYLGAEARGSLDARQMLLPVQVVAPLHDEGIHFVVRSDSPMNNLHDLAQARINLGPLHSGTALTVSNLYRLLFDTAIPDHRASFLPHEDALVKLITEQTIDAVAIVASRPARLLANMKPEARNFVKLLMFDASHPSAPAILGVYAPVTDAATDYPNLLKADQPALAVRMLLVAAGHGEKNRALLARFAQAWCVNFPRIKAENQPQWAGIELLPTPAIPGWTSSAVSERAIRACMEDRSPPPEPCSQEDRLLGLCN